MAEIFTVGVQTRGEIFLLLCCGVSCTAGSRVATSKAKFFSAGHLGITQLARQAVLKTWQGWRKFSLWGILPYTLAYAGPLCAYTASFRDTMACTRSRINTLAMFGAQIST